MRTPIGKTTPDPTGEFLDTGFEMFSSKYGIHGLAKEYGRRLDLLAVRAFTPGQGCFRQFIAACQKHYFAISVIAIWNDDLRAALGRYGFHPDGDDAMTWRKNKEDPCESRESESG